jgi:hypothetical protein
MATYAFMTEEILSARAESCLCQEGAGQHFRLVAHPFVIGGSRSLRGRGDDPTR